MEKIMEIPRYSDTREESKPFRCRVYVDGKEVKRCLAYNMNSGYAVGNVDTENPPVFPSFGEEYAQPSSPPWFTAVDGWRVDGRPNIDIIKVYYHGEITIVPVEDNEDGDAS